MKPIRTFLAAVALVVAGCRVSDVRDMSINLPGLQSDEDKAKITQAIAALPGIVQESLQFDKEKKILTLRYDSMQIAHKNIEIAIAEAGYDANGIPAIKPDPAPATPKP